MYAVVKTGGKQYKVTQGDRLRIELIDAGVGDTVNLDQVCLLVKDDGVVTDPEALASSKVVAQVIAQGRRKKIRVFKYKRRKNYHRTYGHRQSYTEIQVQDIQA
jgi:large subunit ribosomal protein L21